MINIGITVEELKKLDKEDLKKTIKRKEKENWKSKVQDKYSYKNYKKIKDMKLHFLAHRSQRQVPIIQWQGMGPARTGRGAALSVISVQ